MSLQPDNEFEGEFYADIVVKGNHIETLANLIQDILELDVSRSPIGEDVFYSYSAEMGVTFIKFKGKGWLYPICTLLGKLREQFPVMGWSNWSVPRIYGAPAEVHDPASLPRRGWLNNIALWIDTVNDVTDEDAEEKAEDLKEVLANMTLEIDDAHS